jgi:hypothetical protein
MGGRQGALVLPVAHGAGGCLRHGEGVAAVLVRDRHGVALMQAVL